MNRADKTELVALAQAFEGLTPQHCENRIHPDWFVDSEFSHECPWCKQVELRIESLKGIVKADELGKMLASAYERGFSEGREAAAAAVINLTWRTKHCGPSAQEALYDGFNAAKDAKLVDEPAP